MQRVESEQVARHALRARICTKCPLRPGDDEALEATEPRSCEVGCTIFENLAPLRAMAMQFAGDRLAAYDQEIRECICQHCQATPTAGDFCSERFTRTCALSLLGREVLSVLETLDEDEQLVHRHR